MIVIRLIFLNPPRPMIQENIDDDMVILNKMMNRKFKVKQNLVNNNKNVTKDKLNDEDIDDIIIKKYCPLDIELYNYALKLRGLEHPMLNVE